MGKTTIPRIERYSLTFYGFQAFETRLFQMLSRELVLETYHRRIKGSLPLHELLENVVKFELAQRELVRAWEPFFVAPKKDGLLLLAATLESEAEARDRFLKVMDEQRAKGEEFRFGYGPAIVERAALSTKVFPWGFRALTSKGYRSFVWAKVDVLGFQKADPLRKIVIEFASVRKGPMRTINWRLRNEPDQVDKLVLMGNRVIVSFGPPQNLNERNLMR